MFFDKKDFDKEFDDFDKKVTQYQKWAIATWLFFLALGLGFIGFIIWAIVMVMRYFGVV